MDYKRLARERHEGAVQERRLMMLPRREHFPPPTREEWLERRRTKPHGRKGNPKPRTSIRTQQVQRR